MSLWRINRGNKLRSGFLLPLDKMIGEIGAFHTSALSKIKQDNEAYTMKCRYQESSSACVNKDLQHVMVDCRASRWHTIKFPFFPPLSTWPDGPSWVGQQLHRSLTKIWLKIVSRIVSADLSLQKLEPKISPSLKDAIGFIVFDSPANVACNSSFHSLLMKDEWVSKVQSVLQIEIERSGKQKLWRIGGAKSDYKGKIG